MGRLLAKLDRAFPQDQNDATFVAPDAVLVPGWIHNQRSGRISAAFVALCAGHDVNDFETRVMMERYSRPRLVAEQRGTRARLPVAGKAQDLDAVAESHPAAGPPQKFAQPLDEPLQE